jgi:hypothetical protein
MNGLETFDDAETPAPEQPGPLLPVDRPAWAKGVAWATLGAGVLYLINPGLGVFELLPDNLPIVGNLDEAAAVFVVLAAMHYLGMRLPDFMERWLQTPMLPASTDTSQEDQNPPLHGDE